MRVCLPRNPAGAPVTLPVHPGRVQVAELDRDRRWVRALDGTEYMPGLVGLNNMKANDYANAAVQVPHMQDSRVSCRTCRTLGSAAAHAGL